VRSRESNCFAHRLDCAGDHEVAGDLHDVRRFGLLADRPSLLADDIEQWLSARNDRGISRDNDIQLTRSGDIGPTEYGAAM